MPDREKIIKGLEKCKRHECDNCTEKGASQAPWDCPAYDDFVDSAIVLLKEQKPEAKWIYGEDETGVDGWHCSECGFFEPWFYEFTDDIDFIRSYKHCPACGRKMTSYTGKPTQSKR